MRAALGFLVVTIAFAFTSFSAWPGSTWPFLAFHCGMIGMVALALVGPVSYAYGFLAAFLFLGFWGKLVAHLLAGLPFIEPTGLFDGSPAAWDSAMLVAAAAALGVASARAIQLVFLSRRTVASPIQVRPAPGFYVCYRKPMWILALLAVLALNLWNVEAAFYQIGVNPRLVLPAHLNVAIAWLINWGFALGVACLVHWEIRCRPQNASIALLGAFVEAAAASISSLSRSAYLFHALAGLLAWFEVRRRWVARAGWQMLAWVIVAFALGFAATLVIVQTLRADRYFADINDLRISQNYEANKSVGKEMFSTQTERQLYLKGMLMQIPFLVVNRWVGLEAVLAVSAHTEKGPALFSAAIREDPKRGVDSIFQRIAGSGYERSVRFTFLTLAGAPALLYYSGSLAVVISGMLLLTALLLATDALARRWTGNPFVVSLAGISMAYTVTQVTFPYLAAIFFLQLLCTLAVIALLERAGKANLSAHPHE